MLPSSSALPSPVQPQPPQRPALGAIPGAQRPLMAAPGGTQTPYNPQHTLLQNFSQQPAAPTGPTRGMPTGGPSDVHPSVPGAPPAPASSSTTPGAPGGPGSYATLQTTDPSHSLLGQTILPGQGVDRYNLANQQFNTFQQQTNPAYEASLRDANRYAAAGGALGSGMLNTSIGDLANQRNLQLQGAQQSFLQNALNGSIDDQYRNLGILQQQQQFQRELQNDAFGQGLAQSQFGYQGNPADTSLMLANLYGNNAAAAGAGVGSLIQNSQLNQAMSNNPMWQILRGQYGGAGGSSPAPSAPQGPTDQYGLPTGLPKTFPGGV